MRVVRVPADQEPPRTIRREDCLLNPPGEIPNTPKQVRGHESVLRFPAEPPPANTWPWGDFSGHLCRSVQECAVQPVAYYGLLANRSHKRHAQARVRRG